jgi:voltage-gated sodium channel
MTAAAQSIASSPWFHRFIVAVIVLAGIVAGLETSPAFMERHGGLLLTLDKFILAIFIAEALVKMATHGWRPWRYFADGWNIFDFSIIVICLLPVGGPFAAVLRLARALRLLRLVSALPKLQLLVGALLKSVSAMGYVGLLMALLFYIYAVAGIHLFGRTDPAHFGSLGAAMLSLFRVVTLDNWGDIFLAQLGHVPAVKVTIYFISFILLGTMIVLNLMIGIILNSMSEMHAEIAARDEVQLKKMSASEAEFRAIESELATLQKRIAGLRHRHFATARPETAPPPSHS